MFFLQYSCCTTVELLYEENRGCFCNIDFQCFNVLRALFHPIYFHSFYIRVSVLFFSILFFFYFIYKRGKAIPKWHKHLEIVFVVQMWFCNIPGIRITTFSLFQRVREDGSNYPFVAKNFYFLLNILFS